MQTTKMTDLKLSKISLDENDSLIDVEMDSLVDETEFTQENKSRISDSEICTSTHIEIPKPSPQINQQDETAVSEFVKPDTLLAKAMLYRRKNPDLWEIRLKELEEIVQMSLNKLTHNLFLTEYHERFDTFNREKRQLDIQLGNKHPNVDIEFGYQEFKDRSKHKTTYKSLSPNDVTIFRNKEANLFEKLQSDVEEVRGDLPELVVSTKAGYQLFNAIQALDKTVAKVGIKMKMYPDCLQRNVRLKTKYVDVNWKGNCTFAHSFVFKGFTIADLQRKFIHLRLVGRNGSDKTTLGSFILAGEKAHIYVENKVSRSATESEKMAISMISKQRNKTFVLNNEFHCEDNL